MISMNDEPMLPWRDCESSSQHSILELHHVVGVPAAIDKISTRNLYMCRSAVLFG
jgi:hypothetical protein